MTKTENKTHEGQNRTGGEYN